MRSAAAPSPTCWWRTPTPAISATARGGTPGATAAGNVRPAGCGPTDLPDGRTRGRLQDDATDERDEAQARGNGFSPVVRAHHSGGELADRACRDRVPGERALPRSGGAGADGALGRDHDRGCAG